MLIGAVYIVCNGNEANMMLSEKDFGIKPRLQIISADAAHILHNDRPDPARFDVGYHALPFRTLKITAGPAVVCVVFAVSEAVLFCEINKNAFLRNDRIAFAGKLVVAG